MLRVGGIDALDLLEVTGPNHVDARHLFSISRSHQGRPQEALEQRKRTVTIDPLLAEARSTTGRIYLILATFTRR